MALLDTLKGLVGGHKSQAEQGVDKAADLAKDKIGHEDQVDAAADKAKEGLDKLEG